jgi:hypothetical protein
VESRVVNESNLHKQNLNFKFVRIRIRFVRLINEQTRSINKQINSNKILRSINNQTNSERIREHILESSIIILKKNLKTKNRFLIDFFKKNYFFLK